MLLASVGFAHSADDGIKGFVQAGWDWGGEEIFSVRYVNGPVARIMANEGLILDAGVIIPNLKLGDSTLETQAMVGLKYVTATGANGKASFTSFPLTLIEQYKMDNGFLLGGGVTYQVKPELSGSGVISALQVRMNNTFGTIAQIGYGNDAGSLIVRYTWITYKPRGYNFKVRGNGFGLLAQLKF